MPLPSLLAGLQLQALCIEFPASCHLSDGQLDAIAGCSATLQQLALLRCGNMTNNAMCTLLSRLSQLKVWLLTTIYAKFCSCCTFVVMNACRKQCTSPSATISLTLLL